MLDGVVWCDNAYAAIEGADALVIITEWNEFRALDLERVKAPDASAVVVDLRNIYEPGDMAARASAISASADRCSTRARRPQRKSA